KIASGICPWLQGIVASPELAGPAKEYEVRRGPPTGEAACDTCSWAAENICAVLTIRPEAFQFEMPP
ncbi:MAG TPA: hypothetical protein VEG60_10260, partial [Candidatus Binatia bacterium]|nr:hypothetical protein [Candidatus Binatia bacterium]